MSLKVVLHPDVFDFLRQELSSDFKDGVLECIEKLKRQQFDGGLRAKKLKGINSRVWEARIDRAIRLIFTYVRSTQPETGKPETYIAIQDILEHDDVSRRSRARKITVDCQWLDSNDVDVIETFGNIDSETLTRDEQNILNKCRSEDLHIISSDFYDELLGNVQWRVLESEDEWRQSIMNGDKDLSLKLTPQEYELATRYGSFLVSGSAGTGKTTVGLYRLVKSLTQLNEGKRLYVTSSPILVKEAEKQFKRMNGQSFIESVFEFKTIRDLCLEIIHGTELLQDYTPEYEVTYQVFERWYYSEYSNYDHKVYPASLVWHEIRGIIKGANLHPNHSYMKDDEYKILGQKRSSVVTNKDNRNKIYEVATRYRKFLEKQQFFDEIDLSRQALNLVHSSYRYQMIICDEVQDFTELQLLLLARLIVSGGQLFFTGDLHQMILPSAFRWEELKSILTKEKIKYNEPEELNTNFRSVGSLFNLANQFLQLRYRLLKETPSKEIAESSGDFRDTARIINARSEEIKSTLQELYPEEAILVRTKEDKDRFSHLKFVFTVEEAKGLEFDTVFLVEFFTVRQNLWTKVLSKQSIKDTEKVELRLELNLLYVAITRARRVLNIWEEHPSVFWHQKELSPFVQSITPELARNARIEPTKQAWLDRGIYYREAGFFEQAVECFEKAFEEKLKLEVQVKLMIQERDYTKAAEILVNLQDWEQAAQVFERVKIWDKASDCWEKTGNFVNQRICQAKIFENSYQWESAALLYEELGLQKDSNRCRLSLPNKPKVKNNSGTSINSIKTKSTNLSELIYQNINSDRLNTAKTVDESNSTLHYNSELEKYSNLHKLLLLNTEEAFAEMVKTLESKHNINSFAPEINHWYANGIQNRVSRAVEYKREGEFDAAFDIYSDIFNEMPTWSNLYSSVYKILALGEKFDEAERAMQINSLLVPFDYTLNIPATAWDTSSRVKKAIAKNGKFGVLAFWGFQDTKVLLHLGAITMLKHGRMSGNAVRGYLNSIRGQGSITGCPTDDILQNEGRKALENLPWSVVGHAANPDGLVSEVVRRIKRQLE
jgi:tetratricopeptide (TPR) repeat protein/mRNA-degrading endonuclease RelE of RelBE toxin-antitoxin system